MPETSLIKRAAQTLRKFGPFAGLETKSAPDMGQPYVYGEKFNHYRILPGGWNYRHKDIDYKREVGELDGHSLVMCVVNYTGTRLPEAKPTVLKKDKAGKLQPEPLHELARLIQRPNQFYIWENYCLAISVSWWIDGNVYFLKDRDISGSVQQIWHIPHFLIRPRWLYDGRSPEVPATLSDGTPSSTYLSHYEYQIPGKAPVLYEAKDIVHIKRGCDTLRRGGVSGFEPLIKELYGDDKMGLFTAAIMNNMGIQVPIIRPKDDGVSITPENAAHMKESWIQKTTGRATGEPVILTEPVDVEKFGFSPAELDLSKLRMIPESRVAAVLGIPAPTLGLLVGLEHGTSYASSKQAREQGYEEVVIPMQRTIAAEIQWQLLSEFEDLANAAFEFDTSEVRVLQEDKDALFKRNSVGYLGGWLMRADARRDAKLSVTPEDEVFFDPRGGSVIREGEDITGGSNPGSPKGFGSVADIEKYLGDLENEMKDFVPDAR